VKRAVTNFFLLFVCLPALAAADFSRQIRELLESSPAARSAFWGILIVDQESGKTLFEQNAGNFFVPASNTKLFTSALALTRLGPAYKFRTGVRLDSSGSIRLVGGGDPNLSNRAIPYRVGPATGDPLQAIEDLAGQVVARGIRAVEGDVIGDDTAYVWQPFPSGWAADDPLWDYGAPASALTVNDNMLALTAQAGAHDGDPVSLVLSPPVEYYEIDNRLRTDSRADRRVSMERVPGSMQLRLWGGMPPGRTGIHVLGIDDPALYAAQAFYAALVRRGVRISGRPVAEHLFPNQVPDLKTGPVPDPPAGREIASRDSAPLVEDLRITDKVSHNLHAEMLLRAVARDRRKIGSRQAGLEELRTFLADLGIDEDSYRFEDGSGLSRLNLVQPRVIVTLLRHMYPIPEWIGLLPVGGEDGTLFSRFGDSPASGRIHAKTGTLSHVSALSGYAERRKGGVRTFSILVNNYNSQGSSEIRAIVDKICNLMVE
jgi:D-alanyl-D-alanine carboxypeptidase/D-alanyl-D-alanine-endopeptidase (penicillin-binding protein 4)